MAGEVKITRRSRGWSLFPPLKGWAGPGGNSKSPVPRKCNDLMSVLIAEKELPQELTADQAVELAYAAELAEVASKLQRGLPTLVECDKDLAPYLYVNLRNRLRTAHHKCVSLDGRPRQEETGGLPVGLIGTMINQLRDAVRGPVER